MKNSATADLWALGNMAGDHEANWEANANVKKNRLSNIFSVQMKIMMMKKNLQTKHLLNVLSVNYL